MKTPGIYRAACGALGFAIAMLIVATASSADTRRVPVAAGEVVSIECALGSRIKWSATGPGALSVGCARPLSGGPIGGTPTAPASTATPIPIVPLPVDISAPIAPTMTAAP